MAWLAREDPEGAARARWLLASWDAVGLWLTGEAVTTVQAHEAVPSPEALEAAGVRLGSVAPALAYGSRLGSLRRVAADALGLRPGIPVVAGVNDGTASMLGAGLRAAGDAVDTGGTSGGIGIYADRPVEVPRAFLAPGAAARALGRGRCDGRAGRVRGLDAERGAGRPLDAGRAVPRGRGGRARRRWARVPAVPRGGAGADLRRGGAWRPLRAHAGPRAGAPRPGGAGGCGVRASARGGAPRGGRRPGPRAAAGRPALRGRCLGPDQGRRPGRPRRDPHRRRDGRPGGRDPGGGRRGRRSVARGRSGGDDVRRASRGAGPGHECHATTRPSRRTRRCTRPCARCSTTGAAGAADGGTAGPSWVAWARRCHVATAPLRSRRPSRGTPSRGTQGFRAALSWVCRPRRRTAVWRPIPGSAWSSPCMRRTSTAGSAGLHARPASPARPGALSPCGAAARMPARPRSGEW